MIKEKSKKVFDELSHNEKSIIVNTLIVARNTFLIHYNGMDIPYFFWSRHNDIFNGVSSEDVDDFLKINDVNNFSIQVVFYLSKYMISKRNK